MRLLTLGAHAQRGLRYLVCVCVCVCVTQHLTFRVTIHTTNHLWPNKGQNFKRFSLEILPSKVMASFTYHGQRPRRYFVFPLTVASLTPKSLTRSSALPTTRVNQCKAASYFHCLHLFSLRAVQTQPRLASYCACPSFGKSQFGKEQSLCSLGIGSKYASEGMSAV